MKIGLSGDWHGNGRWAKYQLEQFATLGIENVMQVGDFGIGWPRHGEAYTAHMDSICEHHGITLYVTPGNHENWDYIDSLEFVNGQAWIGNRIAVLQRNVRFELGGRLFLSLGGAPSIDFPARTKGVSWWPQEGLTDSDVHRAAVQGHVDVMLAHDAPDGGTEKVQRIIDKPDDGFWSKQGLAYAKAGRERMNVAFAGVQPKVFAHGHYHVADTKQVDETLFLALGGDGEPKNSGVLDLDDLTFEWIEKIPHKAGW